MVFSFRDEQGKILYEKLKTTAVEAYTGENKYYYWGGTAALIILLILIYSED